MLAEPKRKQHWVLNPRGKLYSEVTGNSTFGQRMLEKMGWSKGKGLGKKENGNIEHIRVTYKNDNKGMGFKGDDGKWQDNQNEFDSLLADLNSEYSHGQSSVQPSNLSFKSKNSKNRLHYHKMMQGKDLSSRSEEDLQCILGVTKKPAVECQMKTDDETGNLVTSGENVHSYFQLKAQKKQINVSETTSKTKRKKKNKRKHDTKQLDTSCNTEEITEHSLLHNNNNEMLPAVECSQNLKSSKKKKNKRKLCVAFEECTAAKSLDSAKSDKDADAEENQHRKCKRRKTDGIRSDETKENLPSQDSQVDLQLSIPLFSKKNSKSLSFKKSKKKKPGMSVQLTGTWTISPLDHESLLKKEQTVGSWDVCDKPLAAKKVRFNDEVTVHAVALHDEVRGGALREFLKNWEF